MPYEVTATRRRPKTFDELAGQEFVAATLKNSLKTGHIAHAYLFSGPRGCGKTSAARILARSLNCDALKSDAPKSAQGFEQGPCGVCDNCVSIRAGASRGAGTDREASAATPRRGRSSRTTVVTALVA